MPDVTFDEITSVATLEKQLSWAENIRIEYAEPLAGVQKTAGGQATYSGNIESMLYEIKKYTTIEEKLSTYVNSQKQYTSSNAGMVEGAIINLNFLEFLTLQHINHLLGMMPAGSTESFKEAMVALYASENAFEKLVYTNNEINGMVGNGSTAKLEVIAYDRDIVKGTNEMLFDVWKVLDGKGNIESEAAEDALEALSRTFTSSEEDFMEPYVHVTFDDYKQIKSRFATDGNKFIAAYGKWAAMIPGKTSSLSDVCAIVFKQWASSSDEEAYNTNIETLKRENRFVRQCEQKPSYGNVFGALETAIAQAMSMEIVEKAHSLRTNIYLELYVTKDGRVKNALITTKRNSDDDIDAEIVRAAKSLTGFRPGRQDGKAINTIVDTRLRF